ncbi:MAG: flagellar export chaperone FlgN [Actinomycetota bacterium]|nr:flagellar export chaperone FlgN [Actinomycetota bacterium]
MHTVSEVRLTALSDILWRERRLLDLLRFKLEEERLLLLAGRTEWVNRASHEVELVLDEVRGAELDRAVALADAAAGLRLGPHPTLALLTAAVPMPWAGVLGAHRRALRVAAREVDRASEANRVLLRQGLAAARRELDALVEGASL